MATTSTSGESLSDRIEKLAASENKKRQTRSQKRKLATLEAASDLALLAEFAVSLCEDPTKVLAFEKDPKAEVLAFGGSPQLAEAVSSGFRYIQLLRIKAGAPNETAVTIVIVVCVV